MKRTLYRILAILCIILGIIGAFLPVMPTVPFLLAALYFSADDPPVKAFINSNRILKKYMDFCQGSHQLTVTQKAAAIIGLWLSLSFSAYFFAEKIYWQILLVITGLFVSVHILRH